MTSGCGEFFSREQTEKKLVEIYSIDYVHEGISNYKSFWCISKVLFQEVRLERQPTNKYNLATSQLESAGSRRSSHNSRQPSGKHSPFLIEFTGFCMLNLQRILRFSLFTSDMEEKHNLSSAVDSILALHHRPLPTRYK